MSFGVRCRRCGLEYASRGTRAFLAQPWRVVDPGHVRLFLDIRRFHREASAFLDAGGEAAVSLGDFVSRQGYGAGFVRHFLLPMTGAIWSASFDDMRAFPARTIFQFLRNHGLLAVAGAPPWFTVKGGSHSYVGAIARALAGRVSLASAVHRVTRSARGVTIETAAGAKRFDAVVLATHADETLAMLADPSDEERAALGAFRYSQNRTVLHTDDPRCRSGRRRGRRGTSISPIAPTTGRRCRSRIISTACRACRRRRRFSCRSTARLRRRGRCWRRWTTRIRSSIADAVAAQPRVRALNGVRQTYFCGAHLRYGFHEDGVMSAVEVAARLGVAW